MIRIQNIGLLSVMAATLLCGLTGELSASDSGVSTLVKPIIDDLYEENNTLDSAYNGLPNGTWLSDDNGLGLSQDEDWFRINVSDTSSRRIQIECLFSHDEGDIDIVLFDSSGINVIGQDSMSATDNEYLDVTAPATGYYYLKVWCRFGYSGNSYNLRWKALPTGEDNYEPNNSLQDAYDGLPEGVWLSSIDGSGFQCNDDWYKINVDNETERRVVVDCLFTHAEGDIDIILYDASGEQLSYPWSSTDNECIDFVVPKTGIYYVKVCYANKGNEYDLCWNTLFYEPPALVSLSISGVSEINEKESASYLCTATYSDESCCDVSAVAEWGVNSQYVSISTNGVLSASSVSSDQPVTVTVAYGGKSAVKNITVKDVPPVVTALSINGAAEVSENSTASYTCTAIWSDGSQSDVSVTAVWNDDSPYAEISAGVLNTVSVPDNEPATITAVFAGRSANKSVTIVSSSVPEVFYMDWLMLQEVPPELSAHEAVVADDGIPNLLKYACGLSAHEQCTSADLMQIDKDSAEGMFSILFNRSSSAVDVELEVLWAPTPSGPWFTVEMTEKIGEEGDVERWKASIPRMGSGFMRLRATSDGEIFM